MKLGRFFLICCVALIPALAHAASSWPSRPIKIVVPYATGGGGDLSARALAKELALMLGTPVLTENRPGAGGTIAIAEVARSAPDGYTLILATNSNMALSPYFFSSLKFEDVQAMAPISEVGRGPMVMAVRSGLPVQSVQELIALMKREPGKLNIGTFGPGSLTELIAQKFRHETSTKALDVPYKGTGPQTTALLGGEIDLVFDMQTQLVPLSKTGKVRLLAVTAPKRLPTLPDVPTLAEAGVPGASVEVWMGLLAPAGTPREITERLNASVIKALALPNVVSFMNSLGFPGAGSTREELAKSIEFEHTMWKPVVEAGRRR